MDVFWWVVGEIYPLRETLTENFDINSANATESNEWTYERTNGKTKAIYPSYKFDSKAVVVMLFLFCVAL